MDELLGAGHHALELSSRPVRTSIHASRGMTTRLSAVMYETQRVAVGALLADQGQHRVDET